MQTIQISRKPIKCHHCHTKTVVEISYGNPTEHVMQLVDERKLVLGGCIITDHSPQWQCISCGTNYSAIKNV